MKRIAHSTRLEDAYGANRDGFTEGTPGVTPATTVPADWFAHTQEEIARAIELLGGTVYTGNTELVDDPSNGEQLGTLLAAMNAAKAAGAASSTDNAIARFDGTGGKTLQNSAVTIDDSANIATTGEYTYASAKTRTILLPLESGVAVSGSTWTFSTGPLVAQTNDGVWRIPVRLPTGSTITGISAKMQPGAARATFGNRTSVALWSMAPGIGVAAAATYNTGGDGVADDGTTGIQSPSNTSLSGYTVDNETTVFCVDITAGNTAAASNDTFYAVALTVQDPGPRNH